VRAPLPTPRSPNNSHIYHRVQNIGAGAEGGLNWIAHPSIPSRGEGKKYRLSNDLFPLPTGGGEGVGDRKSLPPLPGHTENLNAMGILHQSQPTRVGLRGNHRRSV
jgi:hypothetical protein